VKQGDVEVTCAKHSFVFGFGSSSFVIVKLGQE
jgi:hypothetical protein